MCINCEHVRRMHPSGMYKSEYIFEELKKELTLENVQRFLDSYKKAGESSATLIETIRWETAMCYNKFDRTLTDKIKKEKYDNDLFGRINIELQELYFKFFPQFDSSITESERKIDEEIIKTLINLKLINTIGFLGNFVEFNKDKIQSIIQFNQSNSFYKRSIILLLIYIIFDPDKRKKLDVQFVKPEWKLDDILSFLTIASPF